VKMNLSWLAVALLVFTISAPASLVAAMASGSDNPNGAPPITYPTPLPPDGNPNGPI